MVKTIKRWIFTAKSSCQGTGGSKLQIPSSKSQKSSNLQTPTGLSMYRRAARIECSNTRVTLSPEDMGNTFQGLGRIGEGKHAIPKWGSAAASHESEEAEEHFGARAGADVAAPEDGRSPGAVS